MINSRITAWNDLKRWRYLAGFMKDNSDIQNLIQVSYTKGANYFLGLLRYTVKNSSLDDWFINQFEYDYQAYGDRMILRYFKLLFGSQQVIKRLPVKPKGSKQIGEGIKQKEIKEIEKEKFKKIIKYQNKKITLSSIYYRTQKQTYQRIIGRDNKGRFSKIPNKYKRYWEIQDVKK